jgi:hypothetical protein
MLQPLMWRMRVPLFGNLLKTSLARVVLRSARVLLTVFQFTVICKHLTQQKVCPEQRGGTMEKLTNLFVYNPSALSYYCDLENGGSLFL